MLSRVITERREIQELVCLLEMNAHMNDVLVDELRSFVHIQIEVCGFSFTYVLREYKVASLHQDIDDLFSSFSILCDDEAIIMIKTLIHDSGCLFIQSALDFKVQIDIGERWSY